jgi:hypothetical protein
LEIGGLKCRSARLVGIAAIRGRESDFGLGAIELAYHLGANRGDLDPTRLLALAGGPLVGRTDEFAFDQDVRSLPDRCRDVLSKPWAEDICYVESDFLRRAFASIKDRFVEGGCVSVRSRRVRTDGRLTVWSLDGFRRFA